MSDKDRFADSPVSRRQFFKLSAATGAALAMPGNATASAEAEAFTTEYRYVLNHTPTDHAVPTLVEFSEESGLDAFESLSVGRELHTTTTPTTAAYAQLTAAEAQQVADLPEASTFQFSPGSNPFWRIGYYPLGIFPEPRRSVDYIGFEQLKDGLGVLEERYPDRIRVKNVGRSPGHFNDATARPDPKGMYVVELTNFDSETAFEDKEKVFFSCSLHGLEMASRETGARVLENVARSSEKDVLEGEEKVEPYLDDVVVVMGFTNPDGWVARNPQYESGWQLFGPDGITGAPLYERGNAEVFDTNRQYPIEGYLDPSHYPAQPNDPKSEEEETPSFVDEKVPDAKALVDYFSTYENLNYGADLHGGPSFNNFVLGLVSQNQFDTRQLHEVYEMCLNIDAVLEEALEIWTTAGDLNKELLGGFTPGPGNFGFVPTEGFDYATIYDTIDYTVSGAFLDWMAHPEPVGLGLTTLDFEMSYNHITGGNVYNPELFRIETDGYRVVIRTITAFAVNNTDTPNTDDEFATETQTDGESVAYVTTGAVGSDEDALRVSSDDLVFDAEDDTEIVFEEVQSESYTGVLGPGTPATPTRQEHSFTTVAEADRVEATASWNANSTQDNELYLLDSEGNRVAASTNFNPAAGGESVRAPAEPGAEYTVVIETYANAAAAYEIDVSVQSAEIRQVSGDGDSGGGVTTELSRTTETVTVADAAETTVEVEEGLHSMGVDVQIDSIAADAELVNPDGEVVASYDGVHAEEDRLGGKEGGVPPFTVSEPAAGGWTFRLTNRLEGAKRGEIVVWTLSSPSPNPDPRDVFGYEQRDYEVTPFRFFEDYEGFIEDGGTVEPVTVEEVANGALVEGGSPAYDHVVVIHGYGANGDGQPGNGEYGYRGEDHPAEGFTTDGYTDALDAFVDSGGNLVLTDAGLNLVPELENGLVDGSRIDGSAVSSASNYEVARFTSKNLDHPLLTDGRPIQNQLWKTAPLGYQAFNGAAGQAPMFSIDETSLAEAAGEGVATVAGSNREGVVAASVTDGSGTGRGVHLVGSLLPRPTQSNVHAFGLQNYTVTFFGNLIMTSALGFQQVRDTGDEVRTFARGDEWNLEGVEPVDPPAPDFSADGSRDGDASVFTGGQTNRVEITVDSIGGDVSAGTEVTVTDEIPDGWTVDERYGDVESVDGTTVTLSSVTPSDVDGDAVTRQYFAEAPEGAGESGDYTFGPAVAEATIEGETLTDRIAGTETVYVAGASTET